MLSHLLLAFLLQAQASNGTLGYQFTVPEGFVDYPEGRATNADLVECWTEEEPISPKGAMVLCVQRLHGVLGRDNMRADEVPAGAQLTALRWRDFDLQGVRALTNREDGPVFSLVAQVPLKPEAIQLLFAGPADQVMRGDSLMQATLASLQGKSNWLTSAERSEQLGKTAGIWISVAFAAGVVWYMRKRRATA